MKISVRWMLPILMSVALFAALGAQAKEPIGWIEKATIYPGGVTFPAKIDSGAKVTSLHCKCDPPFERNGKKWIAIPMLDSHGKSIVIEREIVRTARIKQHTGISSKRYVVMLGVCVKNVYKNVQVSLVDRSRYSYPLLIGRNFLAGSFLIDTGAKYTAQPACKHVPK